MTPHKLVYLDHPSTSWPKSAQVLPAMSRALACAGSPSRAAHHGALEADRLLRFARRTAAQFFGLRESPGLIFVPGATFGLNFVLQGLLEPGERAAVFCGEHNAVTRPLGELARGTGVRLRWIATDPEGFIDLADAQRAVSEARTKALVCQQASNVTGALQPISALAEIAHAQGALLIVDAAQAAGHLPIALEELGADAWVCSGHKALRGPAGSGLAWLAPELPVRPLVVGGTGAGERFCDPDPRHRERPGDYEAGTTALPAFCGLAGAIEELRERQSAFHATEHQRIARLIDGLEALEVPTLHLIGPRDSARRVPLISCYDERYDSDRLAFDLDSKFNIAVRAGRHCAPSLYDALGLAPSGALRFGVGPQTTEEEIDYAVEALGLLLQ